MQSGNMNVRCKLPLLSAKLISVEMEFEFQFRREEATEYKFKTFYIFSLCKEWPKRVIGC